MAGFFDKLTEAFGTESRVPETTVAFNIHPIFDLSASNWVMADNGQMINYGGLCAATGIIGGTNLGKTALTLDLIALVNYRYNGNTVIIETENTLKPPRVQRALDRNIPITLSAGWNIVPDNWSSVDEKDRDSYRFQMVAGYTKTVGDIYEILRTLMTDREKLKKTKGETYTLPTKTLAGEEQRRVWPLFNAWDSWSKAKTGVSLTVMEKEGAESSKNNKGGMDGGAIKGRILVDSVQLQQRGEMYSIYTAALGDDYNLGGQPKPKEYQHLPMGKMPKDVSKKYMELLNHVYYFGQPKPLLASDNKCPRFPFDADELARAKALDNDRFKGLEITQCKDLRGKGGTSGTAYPLLKDQARGVQWDLTSYYLCEKWIVKSYWDYGITGGNNALRMDLYPSGESFTKNTLREKMAADPLLRRAIELTASMKMIFVCERDDDWVHLEMTPKECFDKITERGYDMNVILHTIGWWQPLELRDKSRPDMSVLDLLRIANGDWKPFWYDSLKKHLDKQQSK